MTPDSLLDRPIAFHRAFVTFAGVTGALMLSQAIYWSRRTKDSDGWFYKTMVDWEDETGLSRREQETARKRLEKVGILSVERRDTPARLYFKVNLESLYSMLENASQDCTKRTIKIGGKRQTRMAESANHSIYTETTTETTTEGTEQENLSLVVNESEQIGLPSNFFTQFINRYNELWKTKMRPTKGRLKQYKTRLEIFTPDEILKALENLAKSPFHHGDNDRGWTADPDFLLRSDEQVDKWLQVASVNNEKFVEPTPMEVWQIAKDVNVPLGYVKEKTKKIMEMAGTGEIEKYRRGRTLTQCLRDWVGRAAQKGEVRHCTEVDLIDLEYDKPKE